MVPLLIGSALLVSLGTLVKTALIPSKGWAVPEEQRRFEREREKWRLNLPVYP
jgi:hypothetical protein